MFIWENDFHAKVNENFNNREIFFKVFKNPFPFLFIVFHIF